MELVKRSFLHCRRCVTLAQQNISRRNYSEAQSASLDGNVTEDGWARRVVSGLQPTGALHVGNYFAVLRRCRDLQRRGEDLTLFIADLHALTTNNDPAALRRNTLEVMALIVASGVDCAQGTVFVQSHVARHAELGWLLCTLATLARLQQLPQFREKSERVRDVPAGLLLYPVLQAADILLYRGTHVPVGADQLQHLQVAAQLVKTFHHRYGRAFPTPRPLLPEDGSDRIRSLRDPLKKMSKSDPDRKATLLLSDSDDDIRLKVRKAITDFTPEVTYDPEARPGVSNLVRLHCLAADLTPEEAVAEAEGLSTAQYKTRVAEALVQELAPVRERARRLMETPELLWDTLRHGAARARRRADVVYADVARLAGLASPYDTHDELQRRRASK